MTYVLNPAYDSTTNSNRVSDVTDKSPVDLISNDYTSNQSIYVDVNDYEFIEIRAEWDTSGTATLTVATSPQNDATAAASCVYTDRTQYGINILDGTTAASSYTNDIGFIIDVTSSKYLRITLGSITTETISIYANAKPI